MSRLLWASLALTLAAAVGVALQDEPAGPVVALTLQRQTGQTAPPRAAVAGAAEPATPDRPAALAPPALRPSLPARSADWPAPSPAGLAAWEAAGERLTTATAAPQPAPSPPAPVFPYRWIGQLDDGAGPSLQWLASDQRTLAVRPGAMVDGRWRLLRPAGGGLVAQLLPDGPTVPVPGAAPGTGLATGAVGSTDSAEALAVPTLAAVVPPLQRP